MGNVHTAYRAFLRLGKLCLTRGGTECTPLFIRALPLLVALARSETVKYRIGIRALVQPRAAVDVRSPTSEQRRTREASALDVPRRGELCRFW